MLAISRKVVIYSLFLSLSILLSFKVSQAASYKELNLVLKDLDFSNISDSKDLKNGGISFKVFYEGSEDKAVVITKRWNQKHEIILHHKDATDTVVTLWGWKGSNILKSKEQIENALVYKVSSDQVADTIKIPVAGEEGYVQASLSIEPRPEQQNVDPEEIEEIENNDEFTQNVLNASEDSLVIVDFYSERCFWCKRLNPELVEINKYLIGKKLGTVYKVKYRAGAIKNVTVGSFPTVIIVKNGKVVGSYVGYRKADFFISEIDRLSK